MVKSLSIEDETSFISALVDELKAYQPAVSGKDLYPLPIDSIIEALHGLIIWNSSESLAASSSSPYNC